MKNKLTMKLFLVLLLPFVIIVCSSQNELSNSETLSNTLKGTVEIDGSSTVALVSEAVAEEFKKYIPKLMCL